MAVTIAVTVMAGPEFPRLLIVVTAAKRVEQALSIAGIPLFSAIEPTLVDKAIHSDERFGLGEAVKAAAIGLGV